MTPGAGGKTKEFPWQVHVNPSAPVLPAHPTPTRFRGRRIQAAVLARKSGTSKTSGFRALGREETTPVPPSPNFPGDLALAADHGSESDSAIAERKTKRRPVHRYAYLQVLGPYLRRSTVKPRWQRQHGTIS